MQLQELSGRVLKLEEENRRLKTSARRATIALAALGGIALLSSMTAAMCETVWAERFVLKDSRGRERGVLTAYETGGVPQFALLDAKGGRALTFGVDAEGRAYLEVAGKAGPVRSHFAVSPEGKATIEPKDAEKAAEKKKDGDVATTAR
jgi:hypothetical protein